MQLNRFIIHLITNRAHTQSLQRIKLHQLFDEVPALARHPLGIVYLAILYLGEPLEVVLALPGQLAHFEHVEDQAEGPEVGERPALALLYHFWCQELRSANKSLSLVH